MHLESSSSDNHVCLDATRLTCLAHEHTPFDFPSGFQDDFSVWTTCLDSDATENDVLSERDDGKAPWNDREAPGLGEDRFLNVAIAPVDGPPDCWLSLESKKRSRFSSPKKPKRRLSKPRSKVNETTSEDKKQQQSLHTSSPAALRSLKRTENSRSARLRSSNSMQRTKKRRDSKKRPKMDKGEHVGNPSVTTKSCRSLKRSKVSESRRSLTRSSSSDLLKRSLDRTHSDPSSQRRNSNRRSHSDDLCIRTPSRRQGEHDRRRPSVRSLQRRRSSKGERCDQSQDPRCRKEKDSRPSKHRESSITRQQRRSQRSSNELQEQSDCRGAKPRKRRPSGRSSRSARDSSRSRRKSGQQRSSRDNFRERQKQSDSSIGASSRRYTRSTHDFSRSRRKSGQQRSSLDRERQEQSDSNIGASSRRSTLSKTTKHVRPKDARKHRSRSSDQHNDPSECSSGRQFLSPGPRRHKSCDDPFHGRSCQLGGSLLQDDSSRKPIRGISSYLPSMLCTPRKRIRNCRPPGYEGEEEADSTTSEISEYGDESASFSDFSTKSLPARLISRSKSKKFSLSSMSIPRMPSFYRKMPLSLDRQSESGKIQWEEGRKKRQGDVYHKQSPVNTAGVDRLLKSLASTIESPVLLCTPSILRREGRCASVGGGISTDRWGS